jgi:hypothetical protein
VSPTDIAQGQLEAYNRQDLDGHCAFYADDVVVADLNGAETSHGIAAYRARYEKLFAEFPENRADVVGRIVVGDTVVDHERVARKPGGDTFDVAAIYTIRGGKIARVDFVRG